MKVGENHDWFSGMASKLSDQKRRLSPHVDKLGTERFVDCMQSCAEALHERPALKKEKSNKERMTLGLSRVPRRPGGRLALPTSSTIQFLSWWDRMHSAHAFRSCGCNAAEKDERKLFFEARRRDGRGEAKRVVRFRSRNLPNLQISQLTPRLWKKHLRPSSFLRKPMTSGETDSGKNRLSPCVFRKSLCDAYR